MSRTFARRRLGFVATTRRTQLAQSSCHQACRRPVGPVSGARKSINFELQPPLLRRRRRHWPADGDQNAAQEQQVAAARWPLFVFVSARARASPRRRSDKQTAPETRRRTPMNVLGRSSEGSRRTILSKHERARARQQQRLNSTGSTGSAHTHHRQPPPASQPPAKHRRTPPPPCRRPATSTPARHTCRH
jgi:hypothetical protein